MVIPNATSSLYDIINISESGNILQFIQGVNNLTNQWFMLLILIAGWIILFVSMRSPTVDNKDALVVSGFITVILGMFFMTLDFIQVNIFILITITFAILFIFITLPKR